jgi:endonuclease I
MWRSFNIFAFYLLSSYFVKCYSNCNVSTYYESIPALHNAPPSKREDWISLAQSLFELLMNTHNVIPYTSSSTDVWDALQVLDQDPGNSSRVWLIYSNRSELGTHHGDSTGWNREHVIPRSYGLFDNGPDYSDLHNLRASDSNVNSARNNLYYDDCYPAQDPSCQQPAHVEAAPDTAKNSLKFMPPEDVKGDLARSAFYMALRYNGSSQEANTEQVVLSPCSCVASHKFGNLTTLLRWAERDVVDSGEAARNNLTCTLFQVS